MATPWHGSDLLRRGMENKGSAFSRAERAALGFEGLLPVAINSIEQQSRRACANITRKTDALEKYIGLAALHDRNETLFYRLLGDHLEEPRASHARSRKPPSAPWRATWTAP